MSASHITTVTPLHHRAPGGGAPVRLRITRRGRIVLGFFIALLVAGLVAAGALLGATRADASTEAGHADFGYVVVQAGDTLWSVATELDSSADPRDIIAEIIRLNGLESSDVQAGQALAVPLRFADAPGVASAAEVGIDV
ncbi:MAG: LysM peptidoglycan-binding domain-containing protein [Leucobacter sp.]|nr:LysM peptidoglycan-binding domain-containing protein [Leucobacter sp.]